MPTDKEFEDFFRERFQNLEETPPAHAWGNIRKQIPPQKRFRWLPAVMFIGLLAIATLMPFLIRNFYAGKEGAAGTSVQNKPAGKTAGLAAIAGKNGDVKTDRAIAGTEDNQANAAGNVRAAQTAGTAGNAANLTASTGNTKTSGVAAGSKSAAREAKKAEKQYARVIRKADKKEASAAKAEARAIARAENAARKTYALQAKNGEAAGTAKYYSNARRKGKNTVAEKQPAEYYYNAEVAGNNRPEKGGATRVAGNKRFTPAEIALLETKATGTKTSLNRFALPAFLGVSSDSALTQVVLVDYSVKEPREVKEWAVTAFVSPQYSFNRVAANAGNEDATANLNADKAVSENFGFEGGVVLQKRIAPNTSLDAGVRFVNLNSSVTYLSGANTTLNTLKTTANFAGLRLGITQGIYKTQKSRIYASGGAGMIFLLNGTTEMYAGNAAAGSNALRKNNVNVYAGFGYERAIGRRTAFLIEPTFNYYLKSTLNSKAPFSQKPATVGLNVGLKYDL